METFLCKKKRISFKMLTRKAGLIFLLTLASTTLFAADAEQRVSSNITNVTVFLNQAQVTRLAKVSVQGGITHLIFDKVSPYINLNSIQVKTENNLSLISISQRNNFLKTNDKPKVILDLEDTLGSVKNSMELLRVKSDALLMEKEVIASNKHVGGANSGLKADDLEDALVLIRKRMIEIGEELLKIRSQETRLKAIRDKLQAQLDEFNSGQSNAVEIVVTVKALSSVNNSRIEISYLVNGASWTPFYDIRVKDTKSPLQLVSKAYITQNSGEKWENVILKLSTANPNENGLKPTLSPNYLTWNTIESTPLYSRKSLISSADVPRDKEMNLSAGNAAVQQTAINIEFNVTSAYTIPSDNNPHQVDLTATNMEAQYAYAAVPKLDKDAFATAKVSGNDLVNQISGEANVYFDGTYTGKTYISGTTSDTMLISLGRDKRIQIQRTLLKDFCSKTFTGNSKKETTTWEISVRNTRKDPIAIIVEDQIPVSTDKDIEVKLAHAGGAAYDETTGKLTWQIQLQPEQSQSVKFSFEVRVPKDKTISQY